jgi:hypothetical protein
LFTKSSRKRRHYDDESMDTSHSHRFKRWRESDEYSETGSKGSWFGSIIPSSWVKQKCKVTGSESSFNQSIQSNSRQRPNTRGSFYCSNFTVRSELDVEEDRSDDFGSDRKI